jgi:hypothetical protein
MSKWMLLWLFGLALTLSPHRAWSATPDARDRRILLVEITKNGEPYNRATMEVARRLHSIDFTVTPLPQDLPCLAGECLNALLKAPSLSRPLLAMTGSLTLVERGCTGTLFLSPGVGRPLLHRNVRCDPAWSEEELLAMLRDDASLLAEEGRQTAMIQLTTTAQSGLQRDPSRQYRSYRAQLGVLGALMGATYIAAGVLSAWGTQSTAEHERLRTGQLTTLTAAGLSTVGFILRLSVPFRVR